MLKIINTDNAINVDLRDIRVHKKLGGTIEETSMVDGIVLPKNKPSKSAGGPGVKKNAKVAVIQFCLSSPKTDVENSVVVQDYQSMDRILREEKKYIVALIKKICDSGADVVLI